MTQLFLRSADMLLKVVLVGAAMGSLAVGGAVFTIVRSSDVTGQNVTIQQTVPFSHQHHVHDIGIDCRHCHQSVETSVVAGVPSTHVYELPSRTLKTVGHTGSCAVELAER